MTGTPIQNGLEDIFPLTNFLRFSIPRVRNPRKIGPSSPAIAGIRQDLHKILIRRTKVDVDLTLPKRYIHVVYIDFATKHEISAYRSQMKKAAKKVAVYQSSITTDSRKASSNS